MPPKDKAAKKEAARARKQASRERRRQIFEAFKMQRREDKALVPLMLAVFLGVTAVLFGLGFIWGLHWMFLPVGIAFGALGAVILFGRRVQRNVYGKAEGQPGAAAWTLENMKGRWRVTTAVAATGQLDTVHRVIGKPGIVLVGEGTPHRVRSLLTQEKKRVARLVGETPIYDVIVGTEEGQVPLRKLQSHLTRLPRNITTAQIDSLENRLAALRSKGVGMPKGPMPQGAKMRNIQRTIKRR
ncbi:membrane protein [Longimycelium tulufanense]|uniref:Membrane protein n=1 Tax=Longimycelium tulufanense TaxID=907463 RepID=A0A8J3CDX9_9PSEU|nr:membrane protein [Longimycelium tulufanense]